MSDRVYGGDEKAKLERLVNEGATVLREIEDLSTGLKETVKAIAEELDIKPALINKAININKRGIIPEKLQNKTDANNRTFNLHLALTNLKHNQVIGRNNIKKSIELKFT